MSKAILAALEQLDPQNDNHWTGDGLPRLDTLKALSGEDVTRAKATEAAPYFTRSNPTISVPAEVTESDVPEAPVIPAPAPAPIPAVEEDTPDAATDEEEPVAPVEPEPVVVIDPAIAEEVAELQKALSATRSDITAALQVIADAQQAYAKLLDQEVELDDKLVTLDAAETSGDAIRGYLANQKKLVADKVGRFKEISDSGISEVLNNLGRMKAPIDDAMTRKRGRGGKRPTRKPL